ncbi:MAG TPA: Uma2 family endonuclease [Chloroflexaceae bacterium]|nr:Uma2 family endonuclease [Chloroflexaceae bacterium]
MSTIPDTATTVVRASHVPGPRQGHWTYADYARLPDPEGFRYEIIDGVLYMAPAPTPEHERLVISIGARLFATFEEFGLGHVYSSPDIDAGPITLRPDLAVVLKERMHVVAAKRLVGPPDLVVEIASPSTAAYDRDPVAGKRGAYARVGVREYWIADPAARSVEVLALEGDAYSVLGTFAGEQPLASRVLPGAPLTARSLFPRDD